VAKAFLDARSDARTEAVTDRQSKNIYTVSHKTCQLTFVHIFAKYWPIFKIVLLSHSTENLQQQNYYLCDHTHTASLHYLAKYKFSKITTIIMNTYAKYVFWINFFTNCIIEIKLRLVLDTFSVLINKSRKLSL